MCHDQRNTYFAGDIKGFVLFKAPCMFVNSSGRNSVNVTYLLTVCAMSIPVDGLLLFLIASGDEGDW